ncbi:hypothetical protein DYU11_07710 [Fibrisoma montanum]|uniref:Uncharacterized protein n=1 Tax=Fibrisoma montanum TaxID=2305895 RepID=A0A418MEF2_9BACT|nr:hypothetical protein [Fibrisoma montanum]RIV25190.1 hypothetical protein DYU11_07710 [Fibrisoma montanum]
MKVYVNLAFLENLFLYEEQTDRHFYIKNLLKSSRSNVEVIVDVDIDEAYNDPAKRDVKTLLRQITQNITASDFTFSTACQNQAFHETGEPRLFFIDGLSLTIDEQFGCFYVSTDCLEKADFLFYAEELRIDRIQRDWSILNKVKHPCNALVLTDNYLFSNDTNLENIKSICANLMPSSLAEGFRFDITLIGYDSKNDFRPIQGQYDNLMTYFKTTFPYPVNLTIIREAYHDRYVFTNYYRIASGKGFALFKNGRLSGNDETTLNCKSLAYEGRLSSTYQTRNEELLKCQKINQAERVKERLAGSRINRLL